MIDTETGDLYLADTYMDFREAAKNGNADSPETAVTFLNRIDRSGQYCYYIRSSHSGYALCRCPVNGGKSEVLHETGTSPYSLCSFSMLWEDTDGSWLLTGVNGGQSEKNLRFAVIRFSPSGNTWKMEVIPLPVIYSKWRIASSCRSAASGYGLVNFQYALVPRLSSAAAELSPETDPAKSAEVVMACLYHIGLMRFLPGGNNGYDTWYLRKTGEDNPGAELLPAEKFLWFFHRNYNEIRTPAFRKDIPRRMPRRTSAEMDCSPSPAPLCPRTVIMR